jgi:hypothetical protein
MLQRFGWLIHPTKCVGTTTAIQSFQALGTLADLAAQTFSVPPATMQRIPSAVSLLAEGPANVPVRAVARLKDLIAATWVSTGHATRIRTRALDAVIDSRPLARSTSKREIRKSWAALVPVGPAARDEAAWWVRWLPHLSGQPIRPRPFDDTGDGDIFRDASETGSGAYIRTLPSGLDRSSPMRALLARVPGASLETVRGYAERGLVFMAALPANVAGSSSTLRELFSVSRFTRAIAHLLRGGRFRVYLDNLVCTGRNRLSAESMAGR